MSRPSIQEVDAAVWTVLRNRFRPAAAERKNLDRFAGRLLSLQQAELLPKGIRKLHVAVGTVVTPGARDYLKTLGIELKVIADVDGNRDGEWGVGIEGVSGTVAAFRRLLLEDSPPWIELEPCPDVIAEWVESSSSRGAVLVTEEASVAVWKACRRTEVRAAAVHDLDSTDRAVRRLGANLLVVEPRGKSIFLMKQICQTFRRYGVPVGLERGEGSCGSPR